MPTKINRAGEQQNYVPAGHGDASGEYGDKEIQNTLGEKSVVCFGKGYSKEDLEQIEKDTETYVNDFPELKDEIKLMGDRNNLEKYVNALREGQTPSEENITKEMARIKEFSWTLPPENELRERAIRNLKSPLKLTRLNNAYAYWDQSNHAMVYMGKMKKLTDEQKDYEYNNNFKSSDKRNATFCHEMGHATYSALKNYVKHNIDKLDKEYSKLTDLEERNKIGPKIRQLEILRDDFESRLSFYKNQNLNENYSKEFNEVYKQKTGLDYGMSSYNRDKYEAEKEVTQELKDKGIKKYNISKYGATNKDEFIAECFSAHYTGMNNELATNVVNLFKQYSKDVREVLK